MSDRNRHPLVFEGDGFSYLKIRMEAYLKAIEIGVFRATT
jgi:hypothetical protein